MKNTACDFYYNELCEIVSKENILALYEADDLYIFSIENDIYEKYSKEMGQLTLKMFKEESDKTIIALPVCKIRKDYKCVKTYCSQGNSFTTIEDCMVCDNDYEYIRFICNYNKGNINGQHLYFNEKRYKEQSKYRVKSNIVTKNMTMA